MNISNQDEHQVRTRVVRSALVLIAWELDQLLSTPDLRRWCSQATINLIEQCMREKKTEFVTRTVVLFARRAAQLASAMSWGDGSASA